MRMNLFGTALSLPVVMNILTGMAVGPRLVAYTSDLWENVSVGRTFLSARLYPVHTGQPLGMAGGVHAPNVNFLRPGVFPRSVTCTFTPTWVPQFNSRHYPPLFGTA